MVTVAETSTVRRMVDAATVAANINTNTAANTVIFY
jgi:hypothetical protein